MGIIATSAKSQKNVRDLSAFVYLFSESKAIIGKQRVMNRRCLIGLILFSLLAISVSGPAVFAIQNPQSGSIGIEGTIPSTPPSRAPTIATPTNGQSFTSTPITVTGLCQSGLLVKLFSNNVFVGSTVCTNGSYTIQIDLFSGSNQLYAEDFDALDQSSPSSNIVTVTFNPPSTVSSTNLLLITSNYAERGADPGTVLTWPISVSGGTAPYALSIDWGDGTPTSLLSEQYPGAVTLSHTYSSAGVYEITIKATDKNGQLAFLQLVGVANGATTSNPTGSKNSPNTIREVIIVWIPAALTVILLPIAFWLGRRYELSSLRKHLEQL
jgi:hypothetical protein